MYKWSIPNSLNFNSVFLRSIGENNFSPSKSRLLYSFPVFLLRNYIYLFLQSFNQNIFWIFIILFIFFWLYFYDTFEGTHSFLSWILTTCIFFDFLENTEKTFWNSSILSFIDFIWIERRLLWKYILNVFEFVIIKVSIVLNMLSWIWSVFIPTQAFIKRLTRMINLSENFKSFV